MAAFDTTTCQNSTDVVNFHKFRGQNQNAVDNEIIAFKAFIGKYLFFKCTDIMKFTNVRS